MSVQSPEPTLRNGTAPVRKRLASYATAAVYRAGWAVICRLPERLAYAMFRLAADVMWRRRGASVERYELNVQPMLDGPLSVERLRALSRAAMRSYLRYWCEAFRLNATDRTTLVARVIVHGDKHLRDPLAAGRGVICALPHMANWDHAGAWAVNTGVPFTTVAERLRPASLFDAFVAYRESIGMEVVAADDRDAFATLSTRLREGRMVALVADRDMTARGIDVTLGGGRTRMPAGPAALALRTGADLVPVSLWYDGPRMRLTFHPPVVRPPGLHGVAAVTDMTQQVADVFTAGIRAHPEDWHMLQRFWLDAPAPHSEPAGLPPAASGDPALPATGAAYTAIPPAPAVRHPPGLGD